MTNREYHHTHMCALALCLGPVKDWATAAQLFDSIGASDYAEWARKHVDAESTTEIQ